MPRETQTSDPGAGKAKVPSKQLSEFKSSRIELARRESAIPISLAPFEVAHVEMYVLVILLHFVSFVSLICLLYVRALLVCFACLYQGGPSACKSDTNDIVSSALLCMYPNIHCIVRDALYVSKHSLYRP